MKQVTREFADMLLRKAEAIYLLSFGWTQDEDNEGKNRVEPNWSYHGEDERRNQKWRRITQSHAMNAQKQVARGRGSDELRPRPRAENGTSG